MPATNPTANLLGALGGKGPWMSGFNFLSGSNDPNSLPALLRQKMAPGLIPGPVQPMPLTSGRAPPLPPGMAGVAMTACCRRRASR